MNAAIPTEHLVPQATLDALQARFGARLSVELAVRDQYGRDGSTFSVAPPDAVVFAESTQDISDAVKTSGLFFPINPGAAAGRRDGQRRSHPHRHAGQEKQRWLRPDPVDGGF
jgi:D-lactate dehydrogenase (cytochrome)